jgi:hypothetical protein
MKTPSALLAAAALALALPSAAGAAAAPEARWTATFEMTQQIDWKLPRYDTTSDCFHRFWAEGNGSETWKMKTRRPVKVLAYRLSRQVPVVFKYGTFDRFAMGGDGLRAAGFIVRRRHEAGGYEPGRCGGDSQIFDPEKYDCGSRLSEYDVTVGFVRGRAYFSSLPTGEPMQPYRNCDVHAPADFGGEETAPSAARFNAAALLSGRRTIVLSGSDSESMVITKNPGAGKLTTRGSIRWTLTLTPAGG